MFRKSAFFHLILAIFAYFALWFIVPRAKCIPATLALISSAIHNSHGIVPVILSLLGSLIAALPIIVFMFIQLGIVYYFSHIKMSFLRGAVVLLALLAGIIGLMVVIVFQSGIPAKMHHFPNVRETAFIVGVFPSVWKMPMYTLVILASACIGYLVSMRIKDKNLLLPVVMFAAYIDFWTVTRGPVSSVMKKAPEIVKAVAAPIPHAGAGTFVPSTMIGPGDFLFACLVFASIHRLNMNDKKNFWFVFVAMTIGMIAVDVGLLPYLPALIVLGAAVIAANWKQFKLSRQEAISTAVVGVLLLISLPLVWSIVTPKTSVKTPPRHHLQHKLNTK